MKATPSSSWNPWPYGIVAVLVLFFGGTVGLVVLSVKHRSELVTADYYERDLVYQERMDRLRRTEPWADRITVAYARETREVEVRVPRPHVEAGVAGTLEFYRPSEAGRDHGVVLEPDSDGVQRLDGGRLMAGKWRVRMEWSAGGEGYFADRILVVPGDGP
ncbi:MAG: FixH family protein [Verrucomicrobiae bacterium]|nr:FixH family protein [Verrucomicrobiae bacterium]